MEDKKTYKMLKTVPGSLDGVTVLNFVKGEFRDDITPELAEQFYHQGAIEEVDGNRPDDSVEGGVSDEGEALAGATAETSRVGNPADARETKVTGPTETKEGEAGVDPDTQHIEELVAVARDTYGLDEDSTMSVGAVKAMIEQAQSEAEADGSDDEKAAAKKTKKRK